MKSKRLIAIVITAFLFAVIISCVVIYYNSQVAVSYFPSPTSEYVVEMRYTSAFSLGYHGKFYLLADGKKFYLNSYAPSSCRWVSDNEFTIGHAGSITGMYKYNAELIISSENADSVEVIYPSLSFR